ncbi:MAG: hypothetical protein HOV81_10890 [Kofleriaceae bacterium]|nr:hypothetical protein [Kofleriaceae bacterium]
MRLISILVLASVLSCAAEPRHPTLIISERRELNERAAVGQARVFSTPSVHSRLAGARAWLAIAKALMAMPAGAYQAARRGIAELGDDYAGPRVRDDTGQRKRFAENRFELQHDEAAAENMTDVLLVRIKMYERRYRAEVE